MDISKENRDKVDQGIDKLKNRLYLEYRSMGYELNEFELINKSLALISKYGLDSIDNEDLLHNFVYQDCESKLLEKNDDSYLEKFKPLSKNFYKKYQEFERILDSLKLEEKMINNKLNEMSLIEDEKNISLLKKMSLENEKRLLINKLNEIRREFEEVKIDMGSSKFD